MCIFTNVYNPLGAVGDLGREYLYVLIKYKLIYLTGVMWRVKVGGGGAISLSWFRIFFPLGKSTRLFFPLLQFILKPFYSFKL